MNKLERVEFVKNGLVEFDKGFDLLLERFHLEGPQKMYINIVIKYDNYTEFIKMNFKDVAYMPNSFIEAVEGLFSKHFPEPYGRCS